VIVGSGGLRIDLQNFKLIYYIILQLWLDFECNTVW